MLVTLILVADEQGFVNHIHAENDIKSVFRVAKRDILQYSFGCNDYCGEWITKRTKKSRKTKTSLRIVGGKRVINPRPWMALIEMTSNQGNVLVTLVLN